MAFNKRTWLGRQGTGLNKFSIGGATPVTIVNQPDSVTQVGDALSAGNLNDLEDRIEDAFDDVDTALDTKADEQDVTNLNNALTAIDHRVSNLEQAKGDYVVQSYKDGSITPSGKGNWAVVEGLRGVSRVENNLSEASATHYINDVHVVKNSDGSVTLDGTASAGGSLGSHNDVSIIVGHCYLLNMVGDTSKAQIYTDINGNKAVTSAVITANSGSAVSLRASSGTVFSNNVYWVVTTDLNIYFGTSDLSFLGNTDSAKLATIQTNYPHLLLPTEYGTRIVDSSYSGVNSIGFNRFDKTKITENKIIDHDGTILNVSGYAYSDFMRIKPETTYYIKSTAIANYYQVHYYDVNKNWIGRAVGSASNTTFISMAGSCYARINVQMNDIDNVNFNLSDNSLNGQTFPYMVNTLSLSYTGKSAGSVYDSCEPNVEVNGVAKKRTTQRIGSVLIPDLPWDRGNNGGYWNEPKFYVQIPDMQAVGLEDILSIYVPTSEGTSSMPNMSIKAIASNNYVYIRDDRYNSVADFKTAMAGVPIYYPKATPVVTLSDPVLDNTLLTEAGGRMATVQTGTVVDGSFDMGFINL